jgi:hypothetical protein
LSCSSIVRAERPLLKPYINGAGPVESLNDCLLHASLAVNVTPSDPITFPAWSLQMREKLTAGTNSYYHSWTDANALGAHASETTLILVEDAAPFFGYFLPGNARFNTQNIRWKDVVNDIISQFSPAEEIEIGVIKQDFKTKKFD